MNNPNDARPARTGQRTQVEASPQRIVVRDGGLRLVRGCVITGLALTIWWPVAILVIAVVVPTLAVAAVLAAGVAAIVAPPWLLVRRLRARDGAQRSTLSAQRVRP